MVSEIKKAVHIFIVVLQNSRGPVSQVKIRKNKKLFSLKKKDIVPQSSTLCQVCAQEFEFHIITVPAMLSKLEN